MEKVSPKWVLALIAAVVVIILVIYYYGKSQGGGVTTPVVIKNDTGQVVAPTDQEIGAANALAKRLNDEMNGSFYGIFSSDDTVFQDLAAQSSGNIFALTFQQYSANYNRSLLQDMERYDTALLLGFNTGPIEADIQRAKTLGLN